MSVVAEMQVEQGGYTALRLVLNRSSEVEIIPLKHPHRSILVYDGFMLLEDENQPFPEVTDVPVNVLFTPGIYRFWP